MRTKVCEEDGDYFSTMYYLGPASGIGISFNGLFIHEEMTFSCNNAVYHGEEIIIAFGNHEDGRLVSGIKFKYCCRPYYEGFF